ncbi:hypothetical protein LguiB_025021 [Lonicera macranthoides]
MNTLWQKAKILAEEASKRTQTLTTSPSKIADIVSETAKRSKDFATEASKKAEELKTIALQQADLHIKSLADQIPSLSLANSSTDSPSDSELEIFGISEDLREFVKGFSTAMFQNFPVQDDLQASDTASVSSNVRQDLSEWQQKHATLVLTTVKEISRLRYELCPRHMRDRRFWKIYFTLVSSHIAPYEKKYTEEIKLKESEQTKGDKVEHTPLVGSEVMGTNLKSKTSTSSAEQDLDSFLLGDLEDGDSVPGEDGENFDDDFDKIDNLDIEDE